MNNSPRWFLRAQGALLLALMLPACGKVVALEDTELGSNTGDAAVDQHAESGGNSSDAGVGGNSQGDAATGGSSQGDAAGGATGECAIPFDDPTCQSCMDLKCFNECNSVVTAKNMLDYDQCLHDCSGGSGGGKTCRDGCASSYPEASKANDDLATCLTGKCATECKACVVSCSITTGNATLDKCLRHNCDKECVDVSRSENFGDYFDCWEDCDAGDTACKDTCGETYPQTAAALDVLKGCLDKNCDTTVLNKCSIQVADNDACNSCINSKCLASCRKCAGNSECQGLLACFQKCSDGDSACQQTCETDHPNGVNDLMDFMGENGCLTKNCATECQ